MGEVELEKQRNMVTKSSINRKPLANLTNVVRKPYPIPISPFSQSKKPGSSTASDSSIGSTQNPISSLPSTPPIFTPAHLVGDEIGHTQRRSNRKEESVALCSSTLGKVKYMGKGSQSSLHNTKNDGNKVLVAPPYSSMEKIKNKRNATNVSSSTHPIKNMKNVSDTSLPHSTMKVKDKGKEVAVQSSYPQLENTNANLSHSVMKRKDTGKSIAVPPNYPSMKTKMVEALAPSSGVNMKDEGKTVMGSSHVDLSHSVMKRKDKGKAIAVPLDCPSMKTKKVEVLAPSSGVNLKDKGKTVRGSSHVDLLQKDEGNLGFTPIYHRTLKKNKESSCPPLLRTAVNRNQDDGREHTLQSKLQTEPPPNKKKRYSPKESVEEYVLPQDFVEQQRAYFKEIDEYELEVEEV